MLLISTFWSTWKLLCDEASFTENNSNECFYLEQLHFSLIQNVIKTFFKIPKYKLNALIFASSYLWFWCSTQDTLLADISSGRVEKGRWITVSLVSKTNRIWYIFWWAKLYRFSSFTISYHLWVFSILSYTRFPSFPNQIPCSNPAISHIYLK